MRKLVLATCAVGLSSVPTWAAPPMATPIYNWTGCYIGGSVGAAFAHKDFSDAYLATDFYGQTPASPSVDMSGWLGGGQIGCNAQFDPHGMFGIEAFGAWTDLGGSSDPFFNGKSVFSVRTDWLASITGRLGYVSGNWLFYGKGGVAWVGDRYNVPGRILGPFDLTGSETRTGWTVGAGIEWGFWQRWSARLEYNYYDFGVREITLIDPIANVSDPADIRQRVQTVTVGINYRFWTP